MRYRPFGSLQIMEMFRSLDNKYLGSYASHQLFLNGWRPDSSGIYVRREGYSAGGDALTPSINFSGPLKVVLVPPSEYGKEKPAERVFLPDRQRYLRYGLFFVLLFAAVLLARPLLRRCWKQLKKWYGFPKNYPLATLPGRGKIRFIEHMFARRWENWPAGG